MRLFVALDLPDGLELPVAVGPPWRAVPSAKRHVTLVFLGDVDPPPELTEPPPSAPLRTAGALALPARRPRVLAVRLEDPTGAHTAHQARVAAALGRIDGRPWLPHVTIARTREQVRGAALPGVPSLEFVPPSMTLFSSSGGRYEALVRLSAHD